MQDSNPQVKALIRQLQERMNRAVEVFAAADPNAVSGHGCAMGGTNLDLLAHNAEHDRMHAGQVSDRRYSLGLLSREPGSRFLAEWYRERAAIIGLLLDLPDEALDAPPGDGDTTIRQIVDHVLYWDEDSVEYTARKGEAPAE